MVASRKVSEQERQREKFNCKKPQQQVGKHISKQETWEENLITNKYGNWQGNKRGGGRKSLVSKKYGSRQGGR